MKREKSILALFLIPALIIMLIQGMIPFGMLMISGVKDTLESNAVNLSDRLIENKKVMLENAMNDQWASVNVEGQELNTFLGEELTEKGVSVSDFLKSGDLQLSYLKKIFPYCADYLQLNTTSGFFIILANDSSYEAPSSYSGFFLRDSDPLMKNISNTDFLLERGNKVLARQEKIPLDSTWTTFFEFEGNEVRSSDNFFYRPFVAAMKNKGADMKNLGYWSVPFCFEEPYLDTHKMITYSVPLLYDDTVYGVFGVEISVSHLREYLSFRELSEDFDAGIALAVKQEDGGCVTVIGSGRCCEGDTLPGGPEIMKDPEDGGLYRTYAGEGETEMYAVKSSLSLYSTNVPYMDTDWSLIGYMTEEKIFGVGNRVLREIFAVSIVGCICGLFCIFVLLNIITRPINRLMTSVRSGIEGIHSFRRSGVREVDELHDVVEKLTDEQYINELHLREEKERYRVAVESSSDIFFTYRFSSQVLEVVNTEKYDGSYDCSDTVDVFDELKFIHHDDRYLLREFLEKLSDSRYSQEVRIFDEERSVYKWFRINGNIFYDNDGERSTIVGYARDIDFQKKLEIAQKEKEKADPVTGFYKYTYGMELITRSRSSEPEGIAALFNIRNFSAINDEYGLTFGDILLEKLSASIKEEYNEAFDTENVFVRPGSDKLLVWLPGAERKRTAEQTAVIQKYFSELVNDSQIVLRIDCGLAEIGKDVTETDLAVDMVRNALETAERGYGRPVFYSELSDSDRKKVSEVKFGNIVSTGFSGPVSLVSLALSLFDKGGKTQAVLDVLSLKINEEYNTDDIMVTVINETDRVNSVEYSWKKEYEPEKAHIHYTESDFSDFLRKFRENDISKLSDWNGYNPLFDEFADGRDGIIVHMSDNGKYMGSLILFSSSDISQVSSEELKELKELGTIIQNRINQERHDLSAKAKTSFLSRMSHEIRTPMNGIIGMTEIALKNGQSQEKMKECLEKIRRSSGYLLGLLNDILDMSKIESGKMQLLEEENNLRKTLDGIENLLTSKIDEKCISFKKEINISGDYYIYDDIRLSQILINLIGNAVKFTSKYGTITLAVEEKETDDEYSLVCFSVRDNGCGISQKDQLRIFQSFEQAGNSSNGRRQGTGLGLAISSRLVHMMGSDISLESRPGVGSIFSFELSIKKSDGSSCLNEDEELQSRYTGVRVLAVEDNDLNLEIITAVLENFDIKVECAVNGRQAVGKLESVSDGYYDMIFMDIMMPVMDGLEATRAIRKSERNYLRTVPVVAMSANAFDDDVRKSHECGMDGHLSKPIDVRKLSSILHEFLSDKVVK